MIRCDINEKSMYQSHQVGISREDAIFIKKEVSEGGGQVALGQGVCYYVLKGSK